MRVFLFRGLAGLIYSTGMDKLAEKLNDGGNEATVHSWLERRSIEQDLKIRMSKGEFSEGVAAVGHSLGGNSANFLADNLSDEGFPLTYVATIDPTEPRDNPKETQADNFRSGDNRAETVEGATDFYRPSLRHTQIDKDKQVHARIIAKIDELDGQVGVGVTKSPDSDSDLSNILSGDGSNAVLVDLFSRALSGKSGSSERNDILAMLAETLGKDETSHETKGKNDDRKRPIRDALGKTVGKFMDGKKTGYGIIGFLASNVLPIVFPQLAPVTAVLEVLRVGSSGLATWGVLGKVEKWLHLLKKN